MIAIINRQSIHQLLQPWTNFWDSADLFRPILRDAEKLVSGTCWCFCGFRSAVASFFSLSLSLTNLMNISLRRCNDVEIPCHSQRWFGREFQQQERDERRKQEATRNVKVKVKGFSSNIAWQPGERKEKTKQNKIKPLWDSWERPRILQELSTVSKFQQLFAGLILQLN